MDGYIAVYGYMCPTISCINTGIWLAWSFYLGSQIGLLIVARYYRVQSRSEYTRIYSILVMGYAVILVLALMWANNTALLITLLISFIPLLFSLREHDNILYYVALIATIYIGFVMSLLGLTPENLLIILVGVISAILELVFLEDITLSSTFNKKYLLLSISVGLIILLVLGFTSVYGLSPYTLLGKYKISTNCTRSVYCVHVHAAEIPLASWGYTLLSILVLGWSSMALVLPPPHASRAR